MAKYSIKIGLLKALKYTVITAIPIAVTVLAGLIPANVTNMSVGAALIYITNLITNWLKNK